MVREVLSLSRLNAMPVDEAAALWLVRRLDGEWPHEQALFQEWLAFDETNRRAWEQAQSGWAAFDGAENDELLEAMRRHAREAGPAASGWPRFAAVAALVLALVAGTILLSDRMGMLGSGSSTQIAEDPSVGRQPPAAIVHYANGRAAPKIVELPDGSRMTLDAETRVAAQFSSDSRSLRLVSGRAFFDVRHDAGRPFSVRAGGAEVTALGTRFDVSNDQGLLRVALVEGRVSVRVPAAAAAIVLRSGQQLVAQDGRTPAISDLPADALDWQIGIVTFENETLAEAARELNRYPGMRLIVRDPRVAGLRISGRFRTGNPERFGRALEQIHPVRIVPVNDDQVEIVPAR